MDENLIDNDLNKSPKDVFLEIMGWWEQKRLWFNLIMIGIILIVVLTYYFGRISTSLNFLGYPFFIQSIFYFILINISYCAGWGIQLLRYYYFRTEYGSHALDYVLFICGTLFTGFLTYTAYLEYFIYGITI